MPRNASGVYTLPVGNPVAGGTIISESWANPTMEDVGNELTNSLDRNGRGGMLVPFKNADGSVSSPGISWSNEPISGLYRVASGDTRMGILGSPTTRWIDDTLQPAGEQEPFEIWNGTDWQSPTTQGALIRMNNDQFLSANNVAVNAVLGIVKINVSDEIEFGPSAVLMPNTLTAVGGVIGNLVGNADTATESVTATVAGTVTDAAQPSITSVGTLTGLTVTGLIVGSIDGNAATATLATTASKWSTARTLTLAGDLSGSVAFDGSANFNLTATVGNNSHTHDGTTISALDAADVTTGVFLAARIPTTLGLDDGAVATPSLFFNSETDMGFYRAPSSQSPGSRDSTYWTVNSIPVVEINDGLALSVGLNLTPLRVWNGTLWTDAGNNVVAKGTTLNSITLSANIGVTSVVNNSAGEFTVVLDQNMATEAGSQYLVTICPANTTIVGIVTWQMNSTGFTYKTWYWNGTTFALSNFSVCFTVEFVDFNS